MLIHISKVIEAIRQMAHECESVQQVTHTQFVDKEWFLEKFKEKLV